MSGVAYAVVRGDPPDVYVADDVEVLSRLLATEVVARVDPGTVSAAQADRLRSMLLDELWGDAVVEWMSISGVAIDVYTHLHVYSEADLPAELLGAQLQFTPLFREPVGEP